MEKDEKANVVIIFKGSMLFGEPRNTFQYLFYFLQIEQSLMGKIENCLINLPTEMEAQGPHNTICKEHEVGNRKYWKVLRGPKHTRKLASSSARWRCGTMTTKHRCTTPPSTEGTRSLSFSSAEVWAVRHG